MTSIKELSVTRNDLYVLSLKNINVTEGFNLRISVGDSGGEESPFETLVRSIMENGFRKDKPLTVVAIGDQFHIIDGHRRFAAIKEAIKRGWEGQNNGKEKDGTEKDRFAIPCMIEMNAKSEVDRTQLIFTCNSGEPLTPWEEAIGIKRFIAAGLSQNEIGRRLGFTQGRVSQLAKLADAPQNIFQDVVNRVLPYTKALEFMSEHKENSEAEYNRMFGVETVQLTGGDAGAGVNSNDPAPKTKKDRVSKINDESRKLTAVQSKQLLREYLGSVVSSYQNGTLTVPPTGFTSVVEFTDAALAVMNGYKPPVKDIGGQVWSTGDIVAA